MHHKLMECPGFHREKKSMYEEMILASIYEVWLERMAVWAKFNAVAKI